MTTDPHSLAGGTDGPASRKFDGPASRKFQSLSGLRTALLGAGAVALPVVLAVVAYLLTAGSLGESAGKLPQERPSVARTATTSRSRDSGSPVPTTQVEASPPAGDDSSTEEPLRQQASRTGSGGTSHLDSSEDSIAHDSGSSEDNVVQDSDSSADADPDDELGGGDD